MQAWFATLSSAGAPFDAMPTEHNSPSDSLSAGWIAIRAEASGRLEGVTGLDRASMFAGIEGVSLLAQPGDDLPDPRDERSLLGYLWGTGWDADEVEARLRAARGCIEVRVSERSAA